MPDSAARSRNLGRRPGRSRQRLARSSANESGTEHINEAIAAFQAALTESPYPSSRSRGALLKRAWGNAYMDLSDRNYSLDLMDKAAAAYHEALKVYPRDRDPSNWAWIKYNLGAVYYEIGARESGTEHLQMAAESLREAMSVLSEDKTPEQYRQTRDNLEQTLDALRKRGGLG